MIIKKRNIHFNIIAFLVLLCVLLFSASCTKPPQVVQIVTLKPEGVKKVKPQPKLTQVERWRNFVRANRNSSIKQKIVSVNEYFNSFEYAEDKYLWDKDDFWATLPETLSKNSGDCEDVSIAKFFTLRYLDVPEENLRITYVISLKTGEPHMVLTFSPDLSQEPIVLDTMNNYLFTVSKRPDLVPVYSFNTHGYWLARKQKNWKGERLGSAKKLSMWQRVLNKMRKEETEFLGG